MSYDWNDIDFLTTFVRHYKPNSVLELGSGFSTVAIARALQENGCGDLVSLESEKRYFDRTRSLLGPRIKTAQIHLVGCHHLGDVWHYDFDFAFHYDLIYIDGPALTSEQESTFIPAEYRWLIVDGRRATVPGKPLSILWGP